MGSSFFIHEIYFVHCHCYTLDLECQPKGNHPWHSWTVVEIWALQSREGNQVIGACRGCWSLDPPLSVFLLSDHYEVTQLPCPSRVPPGYMVPPQAQSNMTERLWTELLRLYGALNLLLKIYVRYFVTVTESLFT